MQRENEFCVLIAIRSFALLLKLYECLPAGSAAAAAHIRRVGHLHINRIDGEVELVCARAAGCRLEDIFVIDLIVIVLGRFLDDPVIAEAFCEDANRVFSNGARFCFMTWVWLADCVGHATQATTAGHASTLT